MRHAKSKTVRRSVALPQSLVDDVIAVAPSEFKGNLNRLVVISLQDYVARRRAKAFQRAMAEMAADPAIQRECAQIGAEFSAAESDGLKRD